MNISCAPELWAEFHISYRCRKAVLIPGALAKLVGKARYTW